MMVRIEFTKKGREKDKGIVGKLFSKRIFQNAQIRLLTVNGKAALRARHIPCNLREEHVLNCSLFIELI